MLDLPFEIVYETTASLHLPMLKKLTKPPLCSVPSQGTKISIGIVPRVDGQLAMARAFGDERLKEHITEEPDIFVEAVDANTESIILASDGLWKVRSQGFLFFFVAFSP